MKKFLTDVRGFIDRGLVPIILASSVLSAVFVLSSSFMPGWITYFASLPASLVIFLTSVARLNDIRPVQASKRWQVRRIGMIMAGMGAAAYCTVPFQIAPLWPTWKATVLLWGVALAWITTPNMPPWWRYVTGEFRSKELKSGNV